MNESNNYIKIEIVKSVPRILMQYEDLESFKSLIFCILSDSGSNLILKTIESELVEQNKTKELEALKVFLEIFNAGKNKEYMLLYNDFPILKPSSFK